MSRLLAASPIEPGPSATDSGAADGQANAEGDRHGQARSCEAAKMTELDALSRVYQAAFQSAALNPELIKALKIVNAKIIECVNESQCTFANGNGAANKDGSQD
jgi:hypothetical protein